MSVSKSFNKAEWQNFMLWANRAMPAELFAALPSWNTVSSWPGKIVAVMDYEATQDAKPCQPWYEGYPIWWHLSNVSILPQPIPCRGNVGMWRLPADVADVLSKAENL